ncbi:pyridoxamine 5'-phosphate oxidase family protein [Emcibacter sp. SYSU 3D8]|uniref:pyridoxamine 5'-phosphate oxidase family protein n=1 Tax=Emcibacter sp. SYSU 3D8 TaxID=3133969 RepID=UPI0031FE56E5
MSDHQELWDLLDDFEFCMATTHDGETMRSRPMAPRVDKEAGVIRFLVENAAPMAVQLQQDQDVLLAFIAPTDRNFISISGTATISQDRGLIKQLWNKAADAWFVGGPENASVVAVTVSPSYAEFWDGTSSTIKTMWEMAKARAKDRKPDLTERKKIQM